MNLYLSHTCWHFYFNHALSFRLDGAKQCNIKQQIFYSKWWNKYSGSGGGGGDNDDDVDVVDEDLNLISYFDITQ